MSSTSTPIPPRRFAVAIKELPLANLHFKTAEIRNSVAHLVSSNQQLQLFADEGDSDCADAIQENLVVIQRMEERIFLLKDEVEGRGFKWADEPRLENAKSNGHANVGDPCISSRTNHIEPSRRPSGGPLGDEELAAALREQMEEVDDDQAQGGVHL